MWLVGLPMSDNNKEWDLINILGVILAFALPLTLLVPNYSLWMVVPKVQVTRFHVLAQIVSWPQLNTTILCLLPMLFCIHLEIRKRKLDEMVERVMLLSRETDKTLEVEGEKQEAAMRACVRLLDASAEQYEHLVLLRDELRARALHHPPAIETSSQDI